MTHEDPSKRLSRADFLRRAAAAGAVTLGGPGALAACGGGDEEEPARKASAKDEKGPLRVYTWAGYDDKNLWKPYAGRFPGEKPRYSFFPDDDSALARARAGLKADVAHPTGNYLQDWVEADLLQPWDTKLIKSFSDLNPALVKRGQVDGKQYGVPIEWGYNSIAYRTDKVDPGEPSWNLLFDDRYKGKISWYDSTDMLQVWGLLNGAENPWNLDDDQIGQAREFLISKKPLVRRMWGTETDLVNDLAAGNVWIAQAWQSATKLAGDKGVKLEYMNPKEGRLAWYETFVLLKDAAAYHHAHAYADALASRQVGEYFLTAFNYGHSNTNIDLSKVPRKLVKLLSLDDPGILDDPKRTRLQEHMPRRALYARTWNEIKAS
jgi:spermidine/putrescine transport system substrate-binding protein